MPWIPAQPLGGPTGQTRLTMSRLDTGRPHLIATTERMAIKGGYGYTSGYGTRVWEVSPALGRGADEPCFFAPSNAVAVAAGELAGREVVAVASLEASAVTQTQDLVLRAYGSTADQIEQIWEAVVFDVPWASVGLCMADVNGGGQEELLVGLGQDGLLVFAATDPPDWASGTP